LKKLFPELDDLIIRYRNFAEQTCGRGWLQQRSAAFSQTTRSSGRDGEEEPNLAIKSLQGMSFEGFGVLVSEGL
jgi:hypothetical protein